MFYNMGYSSLSHFTAVKTQDKEETFGLWTLNMDNLFLLTHVQNWYFLFMKSSTSGEKVLQSARPTEGGGGNAQKDKALFKKGLSTLNH